MVIAFSGVDKVELVIPIKKIQIPAIGPIVVPTCQNPLRLLLSKKGDITKSDLLKGLSGISLFEIESLEKIVILFGVLVNLTYQESRPLVSIPRKGTYALHL